MIEFYWEVAQRGYAWQKLRALKARTPARYLLKTASPEEVEDYRNYPVFKESGLFRTFADLQLTEASIAQFANRYGRLLGANLGVLVNRPLSQKGRFQPDSAETFEGWAKEIQEMRHAIDLEDKASAGHSSDLEKFVSWFGPAGDRNVRYREPHFHYVQPPKVLVIPQAKVTAWGLQDGDLVGPTKEFVRRFINSKLKEHEALPQLLWDRTPRASNRRFRVVPQSLIAALWIQFALAVEGNRQYRQCEVCGKWFEVAAEKREDARFCSDPCRFKAYRLRQKEAKRLHAEGKSLKAIATQLGSEIDTVKGWISK